MNTPHLSEEMLQQAAEGTALLSYDESLHIMNCQYCKNVVFLYQGIFSGIAAQSKTQVEAEEVAYIISHMLQPRASYGWLLIVLCLFVAGLISWYVLLFWPDIRQIFTEIKSASGIVIVLVAICITIIYCIEMLLSYRRRISMATIA